MSKLFLSILINSCFLGCVFALIDLQPQVPIEDVFRQQTLDGHNKLRENFGLPALKSDRTLEQFSYFWAKTQAYFDTFDHSFHENLGENMYWTTNLAADRSAPEAIKSWFDEIQLYNYHEPESSLDALHFSQMIWKGTTHVGCGQASSGKKITVVCSYYPRGNIFGTFAENVPYPIQKM